MFDTRVADIRAGNWVKWSNQHAEGIVLQPPNGPTVRGRTALLAWGQAFPPINSLELSDIQIWGDGNLAYATSAYTLKLKDLQADVGKELLVFRRSPGDQWQVVALSLNSDLPRPAASPANPPSK
jgi:ketosteroid isomerase-like protein